MNWIILIGAPAVGKTTLAHQIESKLPNSKIYSFDDELNSFEYSSTKELRKRFLSKILLSENDKCNNVIIDDTTHLKSIQKSYITASVNLNIRYVFIYISAKVEQIALLLARNSCRDSPIKDQFIYKLVELFTRNTPKKLNNLIEFNFQEPPNLNDLLSKITTCFDNYSYSCTLPPTSSTPDPHSDENYFNKLNRSINTAIHQAAALKNNNNQNCWDGKKISMAKRSYINTIRSQQHGEEIEKDIQELVLDFTNKYLL